MPAVANQPVATPIQIKRIELILQQLEQLPTLPAVAARVAEIVGDDNSDAKQVAELISGDAVLSSRVLQLVHRADSGVSGEVNTVERAIVLLGFDAIRSAVLAISVFQTFGATSGPVFSREEFWKHCLAVACCAELLVENSATNEPRIAPAEAFVCGLLHDLGKIALDALLPKSYARVVEAADLLRGNIADVERNIIGLDHLVAGKRLAEQWNLPSAIRECIWLHGQLPQSLPNNVKNKRMVNLISLADALVRRQHLGYSGNYTFPIPPEDFMQPAGVSQQSVDAAIRRLVERMEKRAAILDLGKTTTGELYQEAINRANQQLGRVVGQLASKTRRLAARSQFFESFNHFQEKLAPDSPPMTVLRAIAQTAATVLGTSAAVAFSLPPAQQFAEVLVSDSTGQASYSDLADCETRPPVHASSDGAIAIAGREMDWLLMAVAPKLHGLERLWICLESDGICIGGVLWAAAMGEEQRLASQQHEIAALASGWALALRTAQIRDESRALAEQLAESNRRLQDAHSEVLRARMMTSIGELAAGAAHEMNNPLAVISGRSQLLASQLTDPKLKSSAELIQEQSHRLSQMISDLMDFAKPVPPRPVESDISELIYRALHEAKRQTDPADRTIDLSLAEVPKAQVDPGQISAAIKEVIDNALLATNAKTGTIEISAAFDPYSVQLVVTVRDNGIGMDEATLKRACDPFFSAKSAGRRRGMGLAKALRWIESSGGSLRLESRVNQGTRVVILLPAATANVAAANTQAERADAENEPAERKTAT